MAIREGFKYYFADFSLRTLFLQTKKLRNWEVLPLGGSKASPPQIWGVQPPPPLMEKIRKVVFETFPKLLSS